MTKPKPKVRTCWGSFSEPETLRREALQPSKPGQVNVHTSVLEFEDAVSDLSSAVLDRRLEALSSLSQRLTALPADQNEARRRVARVVKAYEATPYSDIKIGLLTSSFAKACAKYAPLDAERIVVACSASPLSELQRQGTYFRQCLTMYTDNLHRRHSSPRKKRTWLRKSFPSRPPAS